MCQKACTGEQIIQTRAELWNPPFKFRAELSFHILTFRYLGGAWIRWKSWLMNLHRHRGLLLSSFWRCFYTCSPTAAGLVHDWSWTFSSPNLQWLLKLLPDPGNRKAILWIITCSAVSIKYWIGTRKLMLYSGARNQKNVYNKYLSFDYFSVHLSKIKTFILRSFNLSVLMHLMKFIN